MQEIELLLNLQSLGVCTWRINFVTLMANLLMLLCSSLENDIFTIRQYISWKYFSHLSLCKKCSNYGVPSSLYFPVFGLNTKIYVVNSVLSLNMGKYGTEKYPYLETFLAVYLVPQNYFYMKIRLKNKTKQFTNQKCNSA